MLLTAVEMEMSFTPEQASAEWPTGLYTCIRTVKAGKYSIDSFWQQVSAGSLPWVSAQWWTELSCTWRRLFHKGWLQGLLQEDVSLSWLCCWALEKLISAISAYLHVPCLSAGSVQVGFTRSGLPSNAGREEELTSALSVCRACLNWVAKHCVASDVKADSAHAPSFLSRVFHKWLTPASVSAFWKTEEKHLKRAGFSERAEHLYSGSHPILAL